MILINLNTLFFILMIIFLIIFFYYLIFIDFEIEKLRELCIITVFKKYGITYGICPKCNNRINCRKLLQYCPPDDEDETLPYGRIDSIQSEYKRLKLQCYENFKKSIKKKNFKCFKCRNSNITFHTFEICENINDFCKCEKCKEKEKFIIKEVNGRYILDFHEAYFCTKCKISLCIKCKK